MDDNVPNKQAEVDAMWSQSINAFVQHTGTPTAQSLYQQYQQQQPHPGGKHRLELRLPDFYADFLRSQTHTAALWMSAQYRHTLHLALPGTSFLVCVVYLLLIVGDVCTELSRGWHHLYVFATVPRDYLAHRLRVAIEHQKHQHDDRVEYEPNADQLALDREVLAFDVVQFEVR